MNVQVLERSFTDRILLEMSNVVEMVENRIQSAILTTVDNFVTPIFESAVRSINASSASVTANLEPGKPLVITASFENISNRIKTFHGLNANDETRGSIPFPELEAVFSVPRTHFDRQSPTRHSNAQRIFLELHGKFTEFNFQ